MSRDKGFPWPRVLVHLLGVLPLASIFFAALTGRLTFNPIQDIEQRLGRAALYFLVASLAVTPIYTLTGWRSVLPRRRALGLYAFLYASLHFITFAVIDYGFDLREIGRLILEKPFILLGLTTGLLLLPLAVTSFDYFMRKMGKKWKSLHRLVYIAGVTVIIHYAWAKKGDLFALQGDILKPLLWGLLVVSLLVLRIPAVRRGVSGLRQRVAGRGKVLKSA
ncbi:MAG: sulfoxide reductase heme-binding subunit YedZ [Chloroflexi bacterium]|nr:sulfoxide reductase heme-binding subunit YedZ [Chloroflexota bacterium]